MTNITLPTNVLRYGRSEPLPDAVAVRAGPLTALFEDGDLRYVKLGDREIVRRVYSAVRDRNWDTIPGRLSNLSMHVEEISFRIEYDVEHRQNDIHFTWHGTIAGTADGTIRLAMDGLAHTTFLRNRIGYCLLHPIRECAGNPCRVEHPDGTVTEGVFPKFIAPYAPFMEIQAISYEATPGVTATIRFEGDIFEMEDQRNWLDASFKTFCTPLRLPWPAEIRAGTAVRQAIEISVDSRQPAAPVHTARRPTTLAVGEEVGGNLPLLGLGHASHDLPLTEREIARLRAARLYHLRVDLRLDSPGWEETLDRARADAKAIDLNLLVAAFVSDDSLGRLEHLANRLRGMNFFQAVLVALPEKGVTRADWLPVLKQIAPEFAFNFICGAGTNANFCEFNRQPVPDDPARCICFSAQPQEHAYDNRSLIEALETHRDIVLSARELVPKSPIAVSPITLRKRFNPYATGPEPPTPPGDLPTQVDVRQMSLFGAAWTLGSVKYLAETGALWATYFETTGWRGIMETEAGAPLPDKFRSIAGGVFPLYHVFADLGGIKFLTEVLAVESSDPLAAVGLAVRDGKRWRMLAANLAAEEQVLRLENVPGRVLVRTLDETTAALAMAEPETFREKRGTLHTATGGALELPLRPYAYIRLDAD